MKSVISDAKQVEVAVNLVKLGARMQVLDVETTLSREKLLKLYKEVKGVSPPKGMLPFSTDWFMTWMPNIHGSLFLDIHAYLTANAGLRGIEATMKSYELYLEHLQTHGLERVLSFTRAWSLVRFFAADMLCTAPCVRCGGNFVRNVNQVLAVQRARMLTDHVRIAADRIQVITQGWGRVGNHFTTKFTPTFR